MKKASSKKQEGKKQSTKTEEKKPKSTPAGLLALSVSSDTTDFVRGKPAEVVTTFEKPAHESDNLFGTKKTETKVNKKRKAAPDGQGGTSKRRLAGETKQQLHAHILSYGSLVLGMTIIGAVKQVNELDLSVSLPNGLSGFLSLRETSDVMSDLVDAYINGAEESDEENSASSNLPKLADLFKPGQLIRTVVISLEKKNNHKRIELSMRSSLFNKPLQGISKKQLKGLQIHGAVQSVQDHGCIVSLGIRDSDDKEITGFIPKAQDVTFVKGAPVECVVTSISKATLSLTADGVQSCMLPQETWSMDALQAGMLVNTTVDQVLPSGLNLSFLGMFFGTVSATHLGMALESFRVKQALVARILYVVPGKRRVGFTLLPNLVANTPHIFPSGVGRGLKIDDAIVSRVDANGLLLTCAVVSTVVQEVKAATQKKKSKTAEVKTEEKQIRTEFTANVHISQAADNHVEDLSKRFTEGQSLACRIIGFDFLDGVAIATLKESVLNETFLSYADVKAGDVVSAKVDSVKSVGLFVLLSKNVKGICKTFQLGDGVVKDMARRFPVGKSLKARVLSVNPENKKLFVTLKKSLITSTYPTLSSYEMCTKGTVAHGFVTSVKDSGVIVEFYNSVHGLVPIQRLRKKNILAETQSATEVFSPGQVLKVKVRTSDAKREKLLLDVVIGAESAEANLLDDTPVAKSQGKTRVGTVVSGKIKNIKEDGSLVIAVDQYPEASAFLSAPHLSDHPSLALKLAAAYKTAFAANPSSPSLALPRLLVLRQDADTLVLTAKSSLLHAVTVKDPVRLPGEFSQVQKGSQLAGAVKRTTEFGVFVEFLNGFTALAPKAQLSDLFVTDPKTQFELGQSVIAKVLECDEEKKLVSLSLKQSDCGLPAPLEGQLINSYFADNDTAQQLLGHVSQSAIFPGATVPCRVAFAKTMMVMVNFEEKGMTGLVLRPFHSGEGEAADGKFKDGKSLSARVLDYSPEKKIVDLSLKPELLQNKLTAKQIEKIQSGLSVGQTVPVVLQLVNDCYFVLTLPEHKHIVGFAATTTYNMKLSPHSVFQPGYACNARVTHVPKKGSSARLFLSLDLAGAMQKRAKSSKFYDPSLVNRTDITPGKVVRVKIDQATPLLLYLSFGPDQLRVKGFAHAAHVLEENDLTSSLVSAFQARVGEIVPAKVMSVFPRRVPGEKKMQYHINVTLRPSELTRDGPASCGLKLEALSVNQHVRAFVNNVLPKQQTIWLDLESSIKAKLSTLDLPTAESDLVTNFPKGKALLCTVTSIHAEKGNVTVSLGASDAGVAVVTGSVVSGRISKLLPGVGLLLHLGGGLSGRVHITDLADDFVNLPLEAFTVGQVVRAYVVAMNDKVTSSSKTVSVGAGDTSESDGSSSDSDDYDHSAKSKSKLQTKTKDEKAVTSKRATQANDPAAKASETKEKSSVLIDLSLRASLVEGAGSAPATKGSSPSPVSTIADLAVNQLVQGYVKAVTKKGCFVSLSRSLEARVLLKDLSDRFIRDVNAKFPPGTLVLARVIKLDQTHGHVDISLKKSVVAPSKDPLTFEQLAVNGLVKGKVTQVKEFGLFIKLRNSTLTGLCHISQVADVEIKTLEKHYEVGDRVKAVVLKLDNEKKRISLGLKPSLLAAATPTPGAKGEDDDNEDEDELTPAAVSETKAAPAKPSSTPAALPKGTTSKAAGENDSEGAGSESDDDEENEDSDAEVETTPAAMVEADESSGSDVTESEEESEDEQAPKVAPKVLVGTSTSGAAAKPVSTSIPMDVDSDGSDEEIPELDVDMSLGPVAGKSSLSARESDSEIESEEAQSSEDDEGDGQDGGKKKGRKAKAFEKKRIENALKEKELDLLEGSAPETADDYERLVVSQPHSSFRWIKYVAYQVGLAQFDKARAVIGRALKAIPATEQQERFNVYVASLNLEHLYGSPESLKQVLVAAAAACEPAKIYTEMAKIYSDNKQHELAKGCYELMLKKFCSANAFVAYATHLSKISAPEEDIKALLNRALERLPKAEHVPLISKFAQLEYKSGVAERGRTMFEGILQSYPKRVDVWSIYLDMEVVALNTLSNSDKKIKQNAVAAIRRVFERTITLPLSSKKMKFFFKRYLTFEQQHGDAASQEHVKEKAREYVLSRA